MSQLFERLPSFEFEDIEIDTTVILEPRTLTCEELKYAREEALKILRENSKEEALKKFTEGLKYNGEQIEGGNAQKTEEITEKIKKPPSDPEIIQGHRSIVDPTDKK